MEPTLLSRAELGGQAALGLVDFGGSELAVVNRLRKILKWPLNKRTPNLDWDKHQPPSIE
jgi:hypothetical protein